MKYWQDYCLVKHIEEHFNEININIGDLHKYAHEVAAWS